jgi:hypothetical protein
MSTEPSASPAGSGTGTSQWFGLLYPLKPGSREAVAELFRQSGRPDHEVRDDEGNVVGKLLTTIVFVGEEACTRVIEVEGDLRKVARHMSRQPQVKAFEQGIAQYLSVPRDMTSPDGAEQFFRRAGMECVIYRRHDD